MASKPERHAFQLASEARYLLHVPERLTPDTVVVITLHGYGQDPSTMLGLTLGMVGKQHIVASLQAPNAFYLDEPPGAGTGYNWGTQADWPLAVKLHHAMVLGVCDEMHRRFPVGPERRILAGYSQPVGLNYRFAATYPDAVRGVVGLCGGVPRDWEEPNYQPVTASLLHIAREDDQYYARETTMAFPERLALRARDVEFRMLPGPHRFPSEAAKIVQPWMEKRFGKPKIQRI
jgi:predicted esterase